MKVLKIMMIVLIIVLSINAQKDLVKKTGSIEAIGFKAFTATAYCLSRNKTAMGTRPRSGIIAADPRVLKLGSSIEILGLGTYRVEDTGGAIRGNKIDIWMPCGKTAKFGRRTVMVKKIK